MRAYFLIQGDLGEIRNWFLYTCWKGCTPTFEAAAITVTDGTHPCFPFFPPDFEEMERTVKIRIFRIFFLEPSGMAAIFRCLLLYWTDICHIWSLEKLPKYRHAENFFLSRSAQSSISAKFYPNFCANLVQNFTIFIRINWYLRPKF